MNKKEMDNLLMKISSENKQQDFDYAGYESISNLKMSPEQLKAAFQIMWEIVFDADKETRDSKYLFGKGLVKSKDIFLTQKEKGINIPVQKEDAFKEKLINVKPLAEFLIKLKEVL